MPIVRLFTSMTIRILADRPDFEAGRPKPGGTAARARNGGTRDGW